MDGIAATAEWVAWLLARGATETTIRSYSSSVSRFLIHFVKAHPSQATPTHVVLFLADVGKNGPHGRRQALKGLRSAFSYWTNPQVRICGEDPTKVMPREKKPKGRPQVALEKDEIARYVFAAAWRGKDKGDLRAGAIMVKFGMGLRRMELASIVPQDEWTDTVRIRGKYGKTRDVNIGAVARAGLELLRPYYKSTILGGIKPATITYWAHQAAVDSGLYEKVKGLVAHVLRASFISHALNEGASPVAVRDQAGHESLATTSGYAAALDGATEEVAHSTDFIMEVG